MKQEEQNIFTETVEELRLRIHYLFHQWRASKESNQFASHALEHLQVSLEELRVVENELREQNQALQAASQALEAERYRYQELFEFAPDGYLVTNLNGDILEANRSAAELFNVSKSRLVDLSLRDFVSPEGLRIFQEHLDHLKKASEAHPDEVQRYREWEITLQPRREVQAEAPKAFSAALTVATSQDTDYLRWSIRDISERKQAEKALQSSESRFRTLAESSSVMILLVQDGQVQYANPVTAWTTGYDPKELVGMKFSDLVVPEYWERLKLKPVRDPQDENICCSATAREEVQMVMKDGDECWIDLTVGVAELEEEPVWIVSGYDITQRIHAERAQKELLRWVVALQEEERRRISRELHDQMGQNLTALTLGLKSLEESTPAGSTNEQLLHRLQHIANDLGREVHRVAFELRPSSLDDLGLDSALINYVEEWSEHNHIPVDVQVTNFRKEPLPSTVATTVFRIVQEAMTNILKHAGATRVSLILDLRSTFVRAIVEDNGVGFELGDRSRKANGRMRLGVLGMKERAELVGGTFVIESEKSKGTTLYVRIPLKSRDKGAVNGG